MSISSAISNMAGGGKRRGISDAAESREPEAKLESGGVREHLKAIHEKLGGKVHLAHSDGYNHTTHQVGEDGKVQGPHDHENLEQLRESMDKFLSEEEAEEAPETEGTEGLL